MNNDYALRPYTINTTGADMTLELLSNKITSGDIVIPEFQRGHVWPVGKASKLVESFLLGLPVPQIFLYQEPETRRLLVVDGQQRLLAIHKFFEGVYKGKEFKLTGIDSEWNGKTYKELSEPDQRKLRNMPLRSTIFEQVDPSDNTSIFEVFERLNTGGMLLNAQEVRNAVIGGDLNKLIKELNQLPAWRVLNGKKTVDDRQKDTEMILRLIALDDQYHTYKKPMNTFLNSYLNTHKTLNEQEKAHIKEKFTSTIECIASKLGDDAFRLKKSVNSALADAVYVGVSQNIQEIPKDIRQRYDRLLAEEGFLDATEQHTTDNDKITQRIESAIEAFRR